MGFAQDHFSGHAAHYSAFRPDYPDALFAYLAGLDPGRGPAWDCATGSGQAAVGLAPHVSFVVASDASLAQLASARAHERVGYVVAPAERVPLADRSVGLVTVAQALHWFDHPRFFAEVRRVARPGGALAAWSYGLATVSPEVDAVVQRLYDDLLGPDWPPERRSVEAGYRDLPFPFEEAAPPPFDMTARWEFDGLLGYVGTWSATHRHRRRTGRDPLEVVAADLRSAWGDPEAGREIVWPLALRIGRVEGG